jgi:hypothetical protein
MIREAAFLCNSRFTGIMQLLWLLKPVVLCAGDNRLQFKTAAF